MGKPFAIHKTPAAASSSDPEPIDPFGDYHDAGEQKDASKKPAQPDPSLGSGTAARKPFANLK